MRYLEHLFSMSAPNWNTKSVRSNFDDAYNRKSLKKLDTCHRKVYQPIVPDGGVSRGSVAVAVSVGDRGKVTCYMQHLTCEAWHQTSEFKRSHNYLRQLGYVRFDLIIYHTGQSTGHVC